MSQPKFTDTLEWFSTQLILTRTSCTRIERGQAYAKIRGLLKTLNSRSDELRDKAQNSASDKQVYQLKQHYYPDDQFPHMAFHLESGSLKHLSIESQDTLTLNIHFGGEHAERAADWIVWASQRLTIANTGFRLDHPPTLETHSVPLDTLFDESYLTQQATTQRGEHCYYIDMPLWLKFPHAKLKKKVRINQRINHTKDSEHLFNALAARLRTWFPRNTRQLERWITTYQDRLINSNAYCLELTYTRLTTLSKSSPQNIDGSRKKQFHDGMSGWIYLHEQWLATRSLWTLFASIHLEAERKQLNGLGTLSLGSSRPPPAPSVWEQHVCNRRALETVINELDEYTDEFPVLTEHGHVASPIEIAVTLQAAIEDGHYTPQPSQVHEIPKANGKKRSIEKLNLQELILHKLLANALSPLLDAYISSHSIGYRKGKSRHDAKAQLDKLIQQKYCWAVETDIADFFESIQFKTLWSLLLAKLPSKEHKLCSLLKDLMEADYIAMNGETQPRHQGLMQGSPLSPLLANFYLTQLDNALIERQIAFVRYADDIVLLTQNHQQAEAVLDYVSDVCKTLHLQLSLPKTKVTDIKQGFAFLGFHFDQLPQQETPTNAVIKQQKPVFITGQAKYLGLNGMALEIRAHSKPNSAADHQRSVVDVIPLRRISQIIVLGNHSLSTLLMSACAKHKISIHMLNYSGIQAGTLSPMNKQYYAVSAHHFNKHQALTEGARLGIAKDLVVTKATNYMTWIKNSYRKGDTQTLSAIDILIQKARQANTIQQLYGYEGAVHKRCFKRINHSIVSNQRSHFTSTKRQRGGPDKLNALLNFGYYWLATRTSALVKSHGLNPYLSFLHDSNQYYETLIYDIMEVFRVHIDRTILRIINRRQITSEHFYQHQNKGWRLKSEGIYIITNQLEITFSNTVNNTVLDNILLTQVRLLKEWSCGESSLLWIRWTKEKKTNESYDAN